MRTDTRTRPHTTEHAEDRATRLRRAAHRARTENRDQRHRDTWRTFTGHATADLDDEE